MLAQFGSTVIIADGWDIRVLHFHDADAARAWTYGAGLPRASKKNFMKLTGKAVDPFGRITEA